MGIEPTHKVPQTFALPLGYAQHMREIQDLNLCEWVCNPPPRLSTNFPYCSFSRTRTYTLTFVVLCDNPFHYETICTGLQTRTVIKGFGDLHATIAPNRMCVGIKRIELLTFRVSGECSNQLSYIPMCWECRIRTYGL